MCVHHCEDKMKKILEIGCGENPNPNTTIRLDSRKLPHVDIVADGSVLPFKNNSLDGIFARHVIEHWSHRLTVSVLKEWYRVLKPGAWLEIHCPDLNKLVLNYINSCTDEYTKLIFDADLLSYYLYGGQEYPENTHMAGFTFESMSSKLIESGFTKISRLTGQEDTIEMRLKAWKA